MHAVKKSKTADQVLFENTVLHYIWQIVTTRSDLVYSLLKMHKSV